jgi:hypothetical protein
MVDALGEDLLGIVLREADLSVRGVCRTWRDAIDLPQPSGDRWLLVSGQWPGKPVLQGQLGRLLCLPIGVVKGYSFTVRRRFGGGAHHIYEASTLRCAFAEHGGKVGLAERLRVKRTQARARRASADANARKRNAELDRGLRALGVAPGRGYWQRAARSSSAFWAANQRQVLLHAAWSHWLRTYPEADYDEAVWAYIRDQDDEDDEDDGRYYDERYWQGQRRSASCSVRRRGEFQMPSVLPWLPGVTTEEALMRACAACSL